MRNNPDIIEFNFTVTAAPGFQLDDVVLSQSPYSTTGTNGGGVNAGLPDYVLQNLALADVVETDPGDDLTTLTQTVAGVEYSLDNGGLGSCNLMTAILLL